MSKASAARVAKRAARKKTVTKKTNGASNGEATVSPTPPEDQEFATVFPVPANLWATIVKRMGSKMVYEDIADLMPLIQQIQPQQVQVTKKQ